MKKHEWMGITIAVLSALATILIARTEVSQNFDSWLLIILWLFVMGAMFGVGGAGLFHKNTSLTSFRPTPIDTKEKKLK